jgi:hypothetical protein
MQQRGESMRIITEAEKKMTWEKVKQFSKEIKFDIQALEKCAEDQEYTMTEWYLIKAAIVFARASMECS